MARKENNVSEKTKVIATSNQLGLNISNLSFNTESILKEFEKVTTDSQGNEIISYEMTVKTINNDTSEYITITDRQAIESIRGLQNTQALDKWLNYRQGAYLVQLMDSRFITDNEIKSVSKLAEMIELGVETSTSNALESVARKLGVTFDENGNLELADNLPILSFWNYSSIISLVIETENGYDRSHLKDFLTKCNISALTSQKKIKELFKKYKNGEIDDSLELPDKLAEKVKKEQVAKTKATSEKERAKSLSENTTLYITDKMSKAKTLSEKKAIALDLIDALNNAIESISADLLLSYMDTFNEITKSITDFE